MKTGSIEASFVAIWSLLNSSPLPRLSESPIDLLSTNTKHSLTKVPPTYAYRSQRSCGNPIPDIDGREFNLAGAIGAYATASRILSTIEGAWKILAGLVRTAMDVCWSLLVIAWPLSLLVFVGKSLLS
ncbi:uncharacterized protein ASPGLDRAFT_50566 [Aspergillus glaucus CBS 516.65]|uniref:Uncharacterized protein n=1 Tax=Aspergillus glaucus CBS 516.65 TaxID=1160497 RepID=A0A1L9VAX9_ASPGL|nr:hypothetical protein ASPGLDRAFT_50566 [Aspergillus glaucus CBS 516.65]OJJ81060.1 hypothetical protein ASPGLDRAFT_50566 [Aspergillus glaucus CBS 516.65]